MTIKSDKNETETIESVEKCLICTSTCTNVASQPVLCHSSDSLYRLKQLKTVKNDLKSFPF